MKKKVFSVILALTLLVSLLFITSAPALAADLYVTIPRAIVGYTTPPSATLYDWSYWDYSNGVFTITMSGQDAYAFTASPSRLTLNGTGNFDTTFSVIAGLAPGTYTATAICSFSGSNTYTCDLSFTVLDTFTVTFADWDGAVLKTQSVTQGYNAAPPANPTRTGYTFIGWNRSYTNVQSNMTVTARYQINYYDITFLDWDGAVLSEQSVVYLGAAEAPAEPERVGYTFTGWDVGFDEITGDLTVTALYEINVYTVSFYKQSQDGNNKIAKTPFATQQVTYNELIDFTKVSVGKNAVWYETDGTKYGAKFDQNTPITGELKLAVKDQNNNNQQ